MADLVGEDASFLEASQLLQVMPGDCVQIRQVVVLYEYDWSIMSFTYQFGLEPDV